MNRIILALCFAISFNICAFANAVTETTISGTIAIKASVQQLNDINNLKIEVVNSANITMMSLTPNIALENNQIIIPPTKIDTLPDDTYKIIVSGDGYTTSTSQAFTLPSLTNIGFNVADFLQIPEKPKIISPDTQKFNSEIHVIFAPVTSDIVIYYTTDGTVPTIANERYVNGVKLTQSAIIKAIAVCDNVASDVMERSYIITHSISGIITLKPDAQAEIPNFKVEIVNSAGVTAMALTTNEVLEGSNIIIPSTNLDLANDTYKIVVSGDGFKTSQSQTFTLPTSIDVVFAITDFLQIPEKPHITSPVSSNFESPITVKFAQVANIEIYYTTDGSTPTLNSWHYNDGILISGTATVKAIAVKDNVESGVTEREYTYIHVVSNVERTPTPINLNTSVDTVKASPKVQIPILPQADKFSDISVHWAKAYIDELVSSGIINGYEDKTFRPDDFITRAEAIKIIVSAMKIEPTQAQTLTFNDNVNIPAWATGYIEVALEKGITNGYDDNTFRALQRISREELSVLGMRAFGATQSNNSIEFTDKNDISHWALGYINSAAGLGIITGYEDNTFRPNNFVTRAEAVVIISKCMHKI